jgi:hypothetical protein
MRTSYYVGVDTFGNPIAVPTGAMTPNVAGSNLGPANIATALQSLFPQVPATNSTNASTVNQTANQLLELAAMHQLLLVNQQAIATGTGDNTVSPLPTSTVKKPWLDAPDGSVPFDPEEAIVLGVVGTTTVVVTMTVPQGYDGVINGFNWNFTGGGFVQGSGDLQAQILRNGVPVRNYDNILTERGSYEIARPIAPMRIWSNDVIELVVNHIANGLLSGNLLGGFVGWFYPNAS